MPTLDSLPPRRARAALVHARGGVVRARRDRRALVARFHRDHRAVGRSTPPCARSRWSPSRARMPAGQEGGKRRSQPTDAPIGTLTEGVTLDPAERVRKGVDHRARDARRRRVPRGRRSAAGARGDHHRRGHRRRAHAQERFTGSADLARALVVYEKAIASAGCRTAMQTCEGPGDRGARRHARALPEGPAVFGVFTREGRRRQGTSARREDRRSPSRRAVHRRLVHHPDARRRRPAPSAGSADARPRSPATPWSTRSTSTPSTCSASPSRSCRARRRDQRGRPHRREILAGHKQWSIRADAARAMGLIGKRDPDGRDRGAARQGGQGRHLRLRARGGAPRTRGFGAPRREGRPARRADQVDPEPRVREVAASLVKGA